MDTSVPGTSKTLSPASPNLSLSRGRLTRSRKRRYISSDSSSDIEPVLPENILEVEKNLHASAVKNNLDDVSVKKILKKVVTNDHVLALVKLREEEENKAEEENMQPKLTRAKVKELMKVSPKTAWNLENMELTPIKHIPVRTRPEVKALIAQELPEDEDDDEYEPTYDDVPSDDEHTLESCSDVDSQPRTPATPRTASPRVPVKDGPFKVPQVTTPRRKLDMDEDATIALRTRSKLSLSSIPIDHIESSFVPPDALPMPVVDDVWSEFLQECLDPETGKEVDDDDDPEYDVAADPESHDEEEDGLDRILKISKKELNDLVTELFSVMPEGLGDEVLTGKLASEPQNAISDVPTHWEGKQEVISDDESTPKNTEAQGETRLLSIGKSERVSDNEDQEGSEKENRQNNASPVGVRLSVVEGGTGAAPAHARGAAPAPLRPLLRARATVTVTVQRATEVLPEQIAILQQQLRQHIQIATSTFLQIFVHPVHWGLAPTYKEYLETLTKITTDNPKSVANVCNLKPAMELMLSWETSVSADTEENAEMVKFIQVEIDRSRKRSAYNSIYVGDFHDTFLSTVANSRVFVYPHLLPPLPFRSDGVKRIGFTAGEDELITLGLDEFWDYVWSNPQIYKARPDPTPGQRWGLAATVALMCKHMLPFMLPKSLLGHIQHVRKHHDADNPINKFFKNREVTPVKHELLPFNPNLTLYEQPEKEVPRIWVRYLAKTSSRFRKYLYKRSGLKETGQAPTGVPVQLSTDFTAPEKPPLPQDFKDPPCRPNTQTPEDLDPHAEPVKPADVLYSVVQTPAGAYLIPLTVIPSKAIPSGVQETVPNVPEQAKGVLKSKVTYDHCECCDKLRKITKQQTLITDYFKTPKEKSCPCKMKRSIQYPKMTKRFRLLLESYKNETAYSWKKLKARITDLGKPYVAPVENVTYDPEDIAAVTIFKLKLTIRTMNSNSPYMKKRLQNSLAKFDPDLACPMQIMKEIFQILNHDCGDLYKECLSLLTMEQADKMGRYQDYFKQRYVRDLIQKIEEHIPRREIKQHVLMRLQRALEAEGLGACDVCGKILNTIVKYPKLAEYVFSLFPHRKSAPLANKVAIPKDPQVTVEMPVSINNTDKATIKMPQTTKTAVKTRAKKAKAKTAKENTKAQIKNGKQNGVKQPAKDIAVQPTPLVNNIDNVIVHQPKELDANKTNDSPTVNGVVEKSVLYETQQTMEYEADHSSSDDEDNKYLANLTIVEEPVGISQRRPSSAQNEYTEQHATATSENKMDISELPVTKTETPNSSESDMSTMIMSEDEIVKKESAEWTRDEDKQVLKLLQQSLTPEEITDRTILEIIEQKKVVQLAVESLPDKTCDDVRERMLYLLEFLVNQQ